MEILKRLSNVIKALWITTSILLVFCLIGILAILTIPTYILFNYNLLGKFDVKLRELVEKYE